jgi:hypothetical protein
MVTVVMLVVMLVGKVWGNCCGEIDLKLRRLLAVAPYQRRRELVLVGDSQLSEAIDKVV